MKSKFLWLSLGLGAGLSLVVVASKLFAPPYTYHGSLIDPPVSAPDISLTDQTGQPFHLNDLKGKVALMFFGYTSCPDVCPATLAQLKQVRRDLGGEADRVRFMLVTVDPEVDTPARLREYLAGFDPTFIGLTGTAAELDLVAQSYGVYHEKPADLEEVDHTARIYVVDAQGNLRLTYSLETTTDALAQDVRQLLGGG